MRAISGDFTTEDHAKHSGSVEITFDAVQTPPSTMGDGKMEHLTKVYETDDSDPNYSIDRPFRGCPTCIVNILDYRTGDRTTDRFGWERVWVNGILDHISAEEERRGEGTRGWSKLKIEWGTEGRDLQILKIGFLVVGL